MADTDPCMRFSMGLTDCPPPDRDELVAVQFETYVGTKAWDKGIAKMKACAMPVPSWLEPHMDVPEARHPSLELTPQHVEAAASRVKSEERTPSKTMPIQKRTVQAPPVNASKITKKVSEPQKVQPQKPIETSKPNETPKPVILPVEEKPVSPQPVVTKTPEKQKTLGGPADGSMSPMSPTPQVIPGRVETLKELIGDEIIATTGKKHPMRSPYLQSGAVYTEKSPKQEVS